MNLDTDKLYKAINFDLDTDLLRKEFNENIPIRHTS